MSMMLNHWLTLFYGLSFGVFVGRRGQKYGYIGMFFPQWLKMVRKKNQRPSIVTNQEPQGETYGHPVPVVKAVYDKLPNPPTNHAWELEIVPTVLPRKVGQGKGSGEASLSLECRLINLLAIEDKDRIVDSTSKDLLWRHWYIYDAGDSESWLEHYSKYPRDKGYYFNSYIVSPITTWANNHCTVFKRQELVQAPRDTEYMIKGGPE